MPQSAPPGAGDPVPRRAIIRVAAGFLLVLAAFALLLEWDAFESAVVEPVTRAEAASAAAVLRLSGSDVRVEGTSLLTEGFTMNVLNGCNGVYALSIFLAAVIAYPSRWREKIAGLTLGSLFLFAVNLIRIVTLFAVGVLLPAWLDWFHLYFWQTLIVLVSLSTWFYWEQRWVRHV